MLLNFVLCTHMNLRTAKSMDISFVVVIMTTFNQNVYFYLLRQEEQAILPSEKLVLRNFYVDTALLCNLKMVQY